MTKKYKKRKEIAHSSIADIDGITLLVSYFCVIGTNAKEVHLTVEQIYDRIASFEKLRNEVATSIDNCQYHLSKTISNIKDNDNFKQECQRIRLMIIVAFHQLGQIIGTTKVTSDESLKEQLTEWIRYMNDLIKHTISILEPGPKLVTKGPVYEQIMKYQGLSEKDMQEAIDNL